MDEKRGFWERLVGRVGNKGLGGPWVWLFLSC